MSVREWFLIGFYGNPRVELRRESWKLLEQVRNGGVCLGFVGGFNEVLSLDEIRGGR